MKQKPINDTVSKASCTVSKEKQIILLKTLGTTWREPLLKLAGLMGYTFNHRHQKHPCLLDQVTETHKKKKVRRSPLKGGAALEYIIVTIFSATAAVTVMDLVKKMMQAQAEKLEHTLEDDQL